LKISAENERELFADSIYHAKTVIHSLSTLTAQDLTAEGTFFDEDSAYLADAIYSTAADLKLAECAVVYADISFEWSEAGLAQDFEVADGRYDRLYLVGRTADETDWKLYEIYWMDTHAIS